MNEFTKEELEYLSHCVSQYLKYGSTPNELSHMRIKIESMIVNYCDHEHTQPAVIHTQTTAYGNRCIKCKRFV